METKQSWKMDAVTHRELLEHFPARQDVHEKLLHAANPRSMRATCGEAAGRGLWARGEPGSTSIGPFSTMKALSEVRDVVSFHTQLKEARRNAGKGADNSRAGSRQIRP